MQALLNGIVIAESNDTIVVDGNHYFPPDSILAEFFTPTDHHTNCHWKGDASYYDVKVGDTTLDNIAWYYPDTLPEADHFKNYVAFYPAVTVTE